jgi:ribosomal protein S18 acetylase RimI-like enzyme
MIASTFAPLDPEQRPMAAQLFHRQIRPHMHMDWFSLGEWMRDPDTLWWGAWQEKTLQMAVGVTIHTGSTTHKPVAWLRFALEPTQRNEAVLLNDLWMIVRDELRGAGVDSIWVLENEPWIGVWCRRWNMGRVNGVVTLRRDGIPPPSRNGDTQGPIRPAREDDLDEITRVDRAAFLPVWRYTRAVIDAAWREAHTVSVMEIDGHMVGFQLRTIYGTAGHLARLAVLPNYQGQGIGSRLALEMLPVFTARRVNTITVNTQADNYSSQRVYSKLGFERAGPAVPVWSKELAASSVDA